MLQLGRADSACTYGLAIQAAANLGLSEDEKADSGQTGHADSMFAACKRQHNLWSCLPDANGGWRLASARVSAVNGEAQVTLSQA